MSTQTANADPVENLAKKLLAAVSIISTAKAALLLLLTMVPPWQPGSDIAWGAPERAVLPMTILSCLLYVASGEAARRQARGAFWFVLLVHASAVIGVARALDATWAAPALLRFVGLLLSVLVLILILLPQVRRALGITSRSP